MDLSPACDLSPFTLRTTPLFDLDGVDVMARVLGCHDGDTMRVAVPVPWAGGAVRLATLRLLGVDTPEMSGDQAARGVEARDFVLRWLAPDLFAAAAEGLSKAAIQERLEGRVVSARVCCGARDKYGRVLARVFRGDECLNDALIAHGFSGNC